MKNIIKLELKAIDFKDTSFSSSCNCAISKAVKRQLLVEWANEGVNNVYIDNYNYKHKVYGDEHYTSDKIQAIKHNFDNTTIRTITLTKV